MKNKYLVVARSGEKSLHMNWLSGATPEFDLVVTFYGKEMPDNWSKTDHCYNIIPIKGSKWKGLYEYFKSNEDWKNYEYILMPDDDLMLDADDLNKLFRYASELSADLCQPALDANSYFSHAITLKHPSFRYRFTNFVELMIPCMSKRMLEESLEMFNISQSGWGMDHFWYEIIKENGFNYPVIIDDITVTHTRPIGVANHGIANGTKTSIDELKEFKEKYQFVPPPSFNLGGMIRNCDQTVTPKIDRNAFEYLLIKDILKLGAQVKNEDLTLYLIAQSRYIQNVFYGIFEKKNKNEVEKIEKKLYTEAS